MANASFVVRRGLDRYIRHIRSSIQNHDGIHHVRTILLSSQFIHSLDLIVILFIKEFRKHHTTNQMTKKSIHDVLMLLYDPKKVRVTASDEKDQHFDEMGKNHGIRITYSKLTRYLGCSDIGLSLHRCRDIRNKHVSILCIRLSHIIEMYIDECIEMCVQTVKNGLLRINEDVARSVLTSTSAKIVHSSIV